MAKDSSIEKYILRALMADPDWRENGVRGRKTAWRALLSRYEGKFERFVDGYVRSLSNKSIHQRVKFIRDYLERHGYIPVEELTGNDFEAPSNGHRRKYKRGTRAYFIVQGTMIGAFEIGEKGLEQGIQIAGAHIDSCGLMARLHKIDANFNIGFVPATLYGGVEPKDLVNVPLSLFYHGVASRPKGGGRPRSIDFVIGESEGEPRFEAHQESFHLEDDAKVLPKIDQLRVDVTGRPYELEPRLQRSKQLIFPFLMYLAEKYGVMPNDLLGAQIWFLPATQPTREGTDKSMITAYGQDNWSSAYALVKGFVDSSPTRHVEPGQRGIPPPYTKLMLFYDREEIGDTGRGGLKDMLLETLMILRLFNLTGTLEDNDFISSKRSWSLFLDAIGAVTSYDPTRHDPRDSPLVHSGIVINPNDGMFKSYDGYHSSPEALHAIRTLLEEKRIPYQFGMMGNYGNVAGGASHLFHPSLSQGISAGVPLVGMHRPTEQTSAIDMWTVLNTVKAFFSISDRNAYWPDLAQAHTFRKRRDR